MKDVEGKRLVRPEITFQGDGDDPPTNISCAEAALHTDFTEQTFTITCRNGVLERGGVSFSFPDTWQQVLPLDQSGGRRSPTDLPIYAIPEDEALQRNPNPNARAADDRHGRLPNANRRFRFPLRCAMGPSTGPGQRCPPTALSIRDGAGRRWANGFSCLCFLLVGAPLAICFRNADFLASFFACFLPILIVYYPLLMFALSQCKNGSLPSYSVWAGNLILAAIGLLFMRRVYRR